MPVYEYECDVCGMRFDLKRHFGERHPTSCPNGHKGVHRVFAAPSIIFKGSGFYVTDHGSNGRTSTQKSKEKEPKTEKKESKPEKVEDKA